MTKICYSSEFIYSLQFNKTDLNPPDINPINVINPYLYKNNKHHKLDNKTWLRNINKNPLEELPTVGKNAWIRSNSVSEFEKSLKTTKGLLNKLTRENFEKISTKIISIDINNIEILKEIANLIFNKAIELKSFADMYVDLCYIINTEWTKTNKLNDLVYSVYNMDNNKWYWTYKYNNITSFDENMVLYGPFFTLNKIYSFNTKSAIENKKTYEVSNLNNLDLLIQSIYIENYIIYTVYQDKQTSKFYFKQNSELYYCNSLKNTIFGNPSPMNSNVDAFNSALAFISFRKLVVNNVQNFFMDGINKEIDSNLSDEEILKAKQKRIANIYFICELFKKKIFLENVIHECICLLLHVFINVNKNIIIANSNLNSKFSSDDDIECVCIILTQLGSYFDKTAKEDLLYIQNNYKKLDNSVNMNKDVSKNDVLNKYVSKNDDTKSNNQIVKTNKKNLINNDENDDENYFDQSKISIFSQYMLYFENISNPSKKIISTRIRFLIKDVIDCRTNNWVERRKMVKSTTLKEVREGK
jgi:hypothetical protein